MLDSADAVSYTHLDVYKRQTWSTGHAEYETLQGRYTYDAQE